MQRDEGVREFGMIFESMGREEKSGDSGFQEVSGSMERMAEKKDGHTRG